MREMLAKIRDLKVGDKYRYVPGDNMPTTDRVVISDNWNGDFNKWTVEGQDTPGIYSNIEKNHHTQILLLIDEEEDEEPQDITPSHYPEYWHNIFYTDTHGTVKASEQACEEVNRRVFDDWELIHMRATSGNDVEVLMVRFV